MNEKTAYIISLLLEIHGRTTLTATDSHKRQIVSYCDRKSRVKPVQLVSVEQNQMKYIIDYFIKCQMDLKISFKNIQTM